MNPSVHPSVCVGALKQLPVEELSLALKSSANTPVSAQTAPLKQNTDEPKQQLEAITEYKRVRPTPSREFTFIFLLH